MPDCRAGTWSFTVSDLLRQCGSFSDCQDPNRGSTANQYDITVLTRAGGIPTRGALDVAIYLVTTSGSPTAAGAPERSPTSTGWCNGSPPTSPGAGLPADRHLL